MKLDIKITKSYLHPMAKCVKLHENCFKTARKGPLKPCHLPHPPKLTWQLHHWPHPPQPANFATAAPQNPRGITEKVQKKCRVLWGRGSYCSCCVKECAHQAPTCKKETCQQHSQGVKSTHTHTYGVLWKILYEYTHTHSSSNHTHTHISTTRVILVCQSVQCDLLPWCYEVMSGEDDKQPTHSSVLLSITDP